MKQAVLIVLGCLALAAGALGVMLPVWPTTPFVLCAAGCFSASSPALYRKLAKTRYFGEYIRNYKDKTGISRSARVSGLVFLWLTLGISALLFRSPHVLIVLGVVGVTVSIHIFTIRRKPAAATGAAPEQEEPTS